MAQSFRTFTPARYQATDHGMEKAQVASDG